MQLRVGELTTDGKILNEAAAPKSISDLGLMNLVAIDGDRLAFVRPQGGNDTYIILSQDLQVLSQATVSGGGGESYIEGSTLYKISITGHPMTIYRRQNNGVEIFSYDLSRGLAEPKMATIEFPNTTKEQIQDAAVVNGQLVMNVKETPASTSFTVVSLPLSAVPAVN